MPNAADRKAPEDGTAALALDVNRNRDRMVEPFSQRMTMPKCFDRSNKEFSQEELVLAVEGRYYHKDVTNNDTKKSKNPFSRGTTLNTTYSLVYVQNSTGKSS